MSLTFQYESYMYHKISFITFFLMLKFDNAKYKLIKC